MIYQDILDNGRGYGTPHVTWIGGGGWRAQYRGCYCITYGNPCEAVAGVKAFYKSNYPAGSV